MDNPEAIFTIRQNDWADFAMQLNQETDRGAAMVGTAFLDYLLAVLIEAFIINNKSIAKKLLNGPTAPIGSFYSRIELSCALGLIGQDDYHDLGLIRTIRNKFAHHVTPHSFSDDKINHLTSQLKIPALLPAQISSMGSLNSRQLFIHGTAMLATFLDMRRRKIKDRRKPAPKIYIEAT